MTNLALVIFFAIANLKNVRLCNVIQGLALRYWKAIFIQYFCRLWTGMWGQDWHWAECPVLILTFSTWLGLCAGFCESHNIIDVKSMTSSGDGRCTSNLFYCVQEKYPVNQRYLEGGQLTGRMRAILVDWLVQVHLRFHLLQETLYLTIAIIDRFLQVIVLLLILL